MIGAIIGDIAGSTYEFNQTKKVSKINVKSLILEDSFYSDDTILTVAILDAILHNKDYEFYLKKYARKFKNYTPNFKPYFNSPFSKNFTFWINGKSSGTSAGNGALMRIAPIGFLFNTEEEIIENARLATATSHNCKEAINCAICTCLIIYLARKGFSKEKIIDRLKLNYRYSAFTKFNTMCYETLNNCLFALFTSNSFEESIKKVISFGGDTDTNACIVGSMAEALYGIDKKLIESAKTKLPSEFRQVINEGYSRIKEI